MKRFRARAAIFFGVACVAMSGRPTYGEPLKVNVRINPGAPAAVLFEIGKEKKYFEREGLDVHEIALNTGPSLGTFFNALADGTLDAAEMPFVPASLPLLRESGVKIVADGQLCVKGAPCWSYVIVRKDLAGEIKTFAELKKRNVRLSPGGGGIAFWFLRRLEKAGVTEKDFTGKEVLSGLLPAMLQSKAVDAGIANEPLAGQLVVQGRADVFAGSDIAEETLTMSEFAYSKRFMADHPQAARRFMVALLRCFRDFSSRSPSQLQDIAVKLWGGPIDAKLWTKMHLAVDGTIAARQLLADQEYAHRLGWIDKQEPSDAFIDSSYLRYAHGVLRDEDRRKAKIP